MGFSLEAMAIIPLCISILAQSTALSEPAATGLKTTACLTARAALERGRVTDSCRHVTYDMGEAFIPGVETCPQKVIEVMSLAEDLLSLFLEKETDSPDGQP